MFLRKVFVSHYCNVPFHLIDPIAKASVDERGMYPSTLVEEIYAASFHLMRNFELAPFASDTSIEDTVANLVENDKL